VWGEREWPGPPGWMGHENVGRIVESKFEDWPVGAHVLAYPEGYNGFVELIAVKTSRMNRLPDEAADVCDFVAAQPLATVLRALSRTGPVINERCAVVGQGPMGLTWTNTLRRLGARQVIAIDRVPWRLEWSKRFGATEVIDSSSEDMREAVKELTGGEMVDFSVEAAGNREALVDSVYLTRQHARLCVFGMPHHELQDFPWLHATTQEIDITMTRSALGALLCYEPAIDMVANGHTDVVDMLTPRIPFVRAVEAFAAYANPAEHEGWLKSVLVM